MEVPILNLKDAEAISGGTSGQIKVEDIDATFRSTSIDLVSKPLGSRILAVSDEWFAEAENLTKPTAPISKPGVFTYAGAWFDGWESRRHNPQPFDYVVFRLGVPSGRVHGVEVDTAFFNGNQAPEIAVEGCHGKDDDAVAREDFDGWRTVLTRKECGPSQRHAWLVEDAQAEPITHVRLLMYPDGGIARFRLYGEAVPVFPENPDEEVDLAAMMNGGVATSCSDQHFGTKDNLLLPGRGVDMGDGWETKRSRGNHIDWVIVRLGAAGQVSRLVVDTAHFRGNFPQKVQILASGQEKEPKHEEHDAWVQILQPQKCGPDKEHEYRGDILENVEKQVYRFVKMVIIPDGGVKRLRVFGKRMT